MAVQDFDPIAGVSVADAERVVQRRVMDMAAHDAVGPVPRGLRRQKLLEATDIAHSVLHLQLGPRGKGPIGQPEPAADHVEVGIDEQRQRVGAVAEEREPAGVADDEVEAVAVHDEVALAVGGDVHDLLGEFDAAEIRAEVVAQEFVVVARHVDESRPLAHLAQDLLDDVVVRLRPIPAALQPPAIDDVADEVDRVGIVMPQKVEQHSRLASLGSEMHVRQEERPDADRFDGLRHEAPFPT